ncbi:transcriptional regulator, BadM/Rrf2 family [Mariprofundus aestuarium]|uniref:Transcriptional regulator, BadM/Rrf2 family n=1 Tax=Mariprofundus aestuarium TaxID=1921086 RepID=A0A2K8KUX5_MARES|nr:SUF system Fe-S cluster assembly regulator [Mariprofundus aestuarium]ATX78547.1 transcriptional regulator, BadM/Rrf2 family [Mariprofundus aestuarium]
MLRLTKLTDYGILLMTRMVSSEQERFTAAELAEITRIPSPTVSKILQMLLHEGLLDSTRGAKGGYRLTRPSTEINVRDIINVFEGSIALTECNLDDSSCDQHDVCSTSNNWKRINDAVRQALQDISLADMTEQNFVPIFRLQRGIAISKVH